MEYSVGSVPYLNAKPLVRLFEDLGAETPVKVLYDVPSQLPSMLQSGLVEAILVSSIEALRRPDLVVADGVSIASRAEVLSVRIFSKVPPHQIRTLALDGSSMTSNALAKVVLSKTYGVEPTFEERPPNQERMLEECDACLLIGDNGMRASGDGLHVLDLGLEWRKLTGLPFVWALWVGGQALRGRLGDLLRHSREYGLRHLEEVIRDAPLQTGLTEGLCRQYLTQTMHYDFGEAERASLERFRQELTSLGVLAREFAQPA